MKKPNLFPFLMLLGGAASALQFGAPFSDHMVLQCDKPLPIWGKATPGEKLTVTLDKEVRECTVGPDGKWKVEFPARKASFDPIQLEVRNEKTRRICADILVGEVWFCSGQSNMQRRLKDTKDAKTYASQANLPQVRYVEVPLTSAKIPQNEVFMPWQVWTSNSVMRLSGVAFHFGKKLSEEINKPIGLISCSWGGSNIQAWIPQEYFEKDPAYEAGINRLAANEADLAARLTEWEKNGKQGPEPKGNHTEDRHRPCMLDNGMVHPIQPFPIRGVIWYQGENDSGIPWEYRSLFKSLVASWRDRWNDPALPVYYVQLPNFIKVSPPWEEFRKMQLQLLDDMEHVGMAVTIDIGDPNNIHPSNKYDVGQRLGRLALYYTYGRKDICPSGPLPASVKRVGNRVHVTWDWTWNGLKTSDGSNRVKGFMLAEKTGGYKPATARIISKDTVEVQAEGITEPAKIRYAFEGNPDVNLVNSENLPASPFLKYF